MFRSKLLIKLVIVVTIIVLTFSTVQFAFAAPPSNDDISSPTVIASLPFDDTVDIGSATRATYELDPQLCNLSSNISHTVWYKFTPTTAEPIMLTVAAANFTPVFVIWEQDPDNPSGYYQLGCLYRDYPLYANLNANSTYYIEVGSEESNTVGTAQVHIEIAEPYVGFRIYPQTPTVFDTIQFFNDSSDPVAPVGTRIYSTWDFGDGTTSTVEDPTHQYAKDGDYTVQLTAMTTDGRSGTSSQIIHVSTPPPTVGFSYDPVDPSVYDAMVFYSSVSDPEGQQISSYLWDFGDGTTSTDPVVYHWYVNDGDYSVKLIATTSDGRTGAVSRSVRVKTHDVAIVKISAPSSANVAQTKPITVSVSNKRYPETVQVDLYKSNPYVDGGFVLVASSTQYVPLRSSNKSTTDFTFNYTFTNEDAIIGKISFKAVATIMNVRDANPSDNTLISSPPTVVKK